MIYRKLYKEMIMFIHKSKICNKKKQNIKKQNIKKQNIKKQKKQNKKKQISKCTNKTYKTYKI